MKRIIIADDSGLARMYIRRCLEIAGLREAEFVEGTNGREVQELLAESPADLVVTDLNMPEMSGAELLKWISESPPFSHTPVMVITSTANEKKIQELQNLGAFAVLGKPISPSTLAAAIEPLFGHG